MSLVSSRDGYHVETGVSSDLAGSRDSYHVETGVSSDLAGKLNRLDYW